jgi:hypothetical protein
VTNPRCFWSREIFRVSCSRMKPPRELSGREIIVFEKLGSIVSSRGRQRAQLFHARPQARRACRRGGAERLGRSAKNEIRSYTKIEPGQAGGTPHLTERADVCQRTRLNELLRQHVGLRRLRAARRAHKLDPLLSIRDFNRAEAHQLLTGGTDPNGWGRRWIRLARTGHDRCCAG